MSEDKRTDPCGCIVSGDENLLIRHEVCEEHGKEPELTFEVDTEESLYARIARLRTERNKLREERDALRKDITLAADNILDLRAQLAVADRQKKPKRGRPKGITKLEDNTKGHSRKQLSKTKRNTIVRYNKLGKTYQEIHDLTGVSHSSIARIIIDKKGAV